MKLPLLTATLVLTLLQDAPRNAPPRPADDPENNGIVEGVVRDSVTHEPIEDVTVGLSGTDEKYFRRITYSVHTDRSGHFIFKDVAPKTYILISERDGYLFPDDEREPDVPVAPKQHVDGLHVELVPGAVISGHVVSADGEPLAGTDVEAAVYGYPDGKRQLVTRVWTTTDDRGAFRIFWLRPGSYYLKAYNSPVRAGVETSTVYYPGTFSQSGARSITVQAGTELTGVDLMVPAAPVVPRCTISGVITGLPPAFADKPIGSLHLVSRNRVEVFEKWFPNYAGDRTNGRFQIRGVQAGAYDLYASVQVDTQHKFTSKIPIEVQTDIENLSIAVESSVDIRGRVTLNGTQPAGRIGSTVGLRAIEGGLVSYSPYSFDGAEFTSDPNTGEFTLPQIPPGKYRVIYYQNHPSSYIADIRQNGRSVFDDGLAIGAQAPEPIEVVLLSRQVSSKVWFRMVAEIQ